MARNRVNAIDWLRGLVMMLMTIDHAGAAYDAHHMHGDSALGWAVGTPLPAGEFLTRWITHLCAPTFVLLAGTSLALSMEKRKETPGQTAFIVKRGLLIAALDPIWMSLGFALYHIFILQVLYAIGLSLVCMAFLRRLSSRALLIGALAIQVFGELTARVHFAARPLEIAWQLLFVGGRIGEKLVCPYPFVPWLAMMMAGWVLGRFLLETRRSRMEQARGFALLGAVLLAVFAVVRGVDGYGNWNLHRDSLDVLQWLHVAKYPPSLSYTCLELGLAFLLLALFFLADDGEPRPLLKPMALFGSTAFFYYLLHAHLLGVASLLLHLDREKNGILKTYLAAAIVLIALYPLCQLYRRYKSAHPDGWTRYI